MSLEERLAKLEEQLGRVIELLQAAPSAAPARWPMTVAQYAEFLGKGETTIHRWIEAGHLGAVKREGMPTMISEEAHNALAKGNSPASRAQRRKARAELTMR